MRLPDLFNITKGTRVVISITLGICGTAILVAIFYYRNLNRAEDPRMIPVREWIQESEEFTANCQATESFIVLDSAIRYLRSLPGYENSYEVGVLYNDVSSAWLLSALYDSTLAETEKRKMLVTAKTFADSSITLYRSWIEKWKSLDPAQIREKISPFFDPNDLSFHHRNSDKILAKRIKDIQSAQLETPRRLSVTLTNLGTIYRHQIKPDSALLCFAEALELWKDNETAQNNLQVLNGGAPVKPSLIRKLFPPDKKK
jgi:tetratricopeptide (TPR) repeat protein